MVGEGKGRGVIKRESIFQRHYVLVVGSVWPKVLDAGVPIKERRRAEGAGASERKVSGDFCAMERRGGITMKTNLKVNLTGAVAEVADT